MKIALVTFDFYAERHGGVSSVCFKVFDSIRNSMNSKIEIVSFSNSKGDPNSISFLSPKSYKSVRPTYDGFFHGAPIVRIGSIGSEFEFMRYRKRKELLEFFGNYDLIIVVTGFLQFANVIPRVSVPVLIQCATRLTWERKSQYLSMSRFKRLFLKSQLPILALQEMRVLRSKATFLVENTRMQKWVQSRAINAPIMWYPGIQSRKHELTSSQNPQKTGCFISIGRLNEARKGWDRLFLAYKKAYDSCNDLPNLVVVGAGSFSGYTAELLLTLLPRYPIKILGKLSDDERNSTLNCASYFLQTSHEEGLGLAALEALSFGVPLICSATDGSREYVIEGVSGTLVEQSSKFIDDFSQAIIRSQTWNYDSLHRSSLDLYNKFFDNQISQDSLINVILSKIEIKS
jgi:glycosyltransferase involved in cell wall biosynthesis